VRARLQTITPVARYTWSRQWRAEMCIGFCAGIFGLAAFAAKRSLGAPEWVVPLIVVAGQLPWILAPAWEPLFARLDPQRAFLWLGALSKGPLLLVAFVQVVPAGPEGHAHGNLPLFIAAVVLFYVVDGAYIPHRGALLRANFPTPIRGRMFGMLSTVALVASMLSAKAGGLLLDDDPRWLRVIFPIGAVVGIVGHVFLARIRWRREGPRVPKGEPGWRAAILALGRAWRMAVTVLRRDRDFLAFEIAFMTYGFGLLMSTPLLVLYAEDELHVSYDAWTWAHGVASPMVHILSIGLIGRLSDRVGVVRTTALSYALLLGFFLAMPYVQGPLSLAAVFCILGLAMAGVSIGWNLGPLRFAPEGRSRTYTGAHLLLVGVRSGTAPVVGYLIATWGSLRTGFLVSAGLMAVAATMLFLLGRRTR
jgi:MFS family permease